VSQGLQTVIQDSTHTVVVGQSGILLGSTATIAFPTVASPTTITSEGIEVPVMPSPSAVLFIDVPQPSEAPRSQVTVNGMIYPLPLFQEKADSDLIPIPQPSGPAIAFGAEKLIVGTQTVSVPSGAQSTTFVGAGKSFQFGPAPCRGTGGQDTGSNNNDNNNGGGNDGARGGGSGGSGGKRSGSHGLGGLFGAIGNAIAGAAKGIADVAEAGVGIVAKTGTELGTDFTETVGPLIDDAAKGKWKNFHTHQWPI
jgi:hypothetical protein